MTDKELLQMTDEELLRLPEVRAAYFGEGPWKHEWQKYKPEIFKCGSCGKLINVEYGSTVITYEPCSIPPFITDPIEVVAEVLWRKAVEMGTDGLNPPMRAILSLSNQWNWMSLYNWWTFHATPPSPPYRRTAGFEGGGEMKRCRECIYYDYCWGGKKWEYTCTTPANKHHPDKCIMFSPRFWVWVREWFKRFVK